MSRPLYETDADLKRETDVVKMFETAWDVSMMKLPIQYKLDYMVTRNDKLLSFCEIKSKKDYPYENLDRNGGFAFSLAKWIAAEEMCKASNKSFILIVKLTDGLYYSRFGVGHHQFKPDDVVISGRIDRGDWQDVEPMVVIRMEKFKKLKDS